MPFIATTYWNRSNDLQPMVARFDVTATYEEERDKVVRKAKDKGKKSARDKSARSSRSARTTGRGEERTAKRYGFELKQRYQEFEQVRAMQRYIYQDQKEQTLKLIPNFGRFLVDQRPNFTGDGGELAHHTTF